MIYNGAIELIGRTPILRVTNMIDENSADLYVKLEKFNPGGSVKDRAALGMIEKAEEAGLLKKGSVIVEPTSGNTGIALAALGTYYNHPVYIYMPDWASKERINIMKLYGAKIYLVSKEEGGFKEAIKRADKLSREIDGFRPDQFRSMKNIETHYIKNNEFFYKRN